MQTEGVWSRRRWIYAGLRSVKSGFFCALGFTVMVALNSASAADRAGPVQCKPFTEEAVAPPAPREDPHSLVRLETINKEIRAVAARILFLGDSITERWTESIWHREFWSRGAINAGIDGDRTEHLLWRLDHGNLDGVPPALVVVLIGTNDLGHGRAPRLAAEGVRANLIRLRQRLGNTPILLLGLTPREDRFRAKVDAVNRLIQTCRGGAITYADIGKQLLDGSGHPPRGTLTDGVHFSANGYSLLSRQLTPILDALLRRQGADDRRRGGKQP